MGAPRNTAWRRQRRRYTAMKTMWPSMSHVWDEDKEILVPKPSRDLRRNIRRFLDEGFDRSGISEGTIVHLLVRETRKVKEFAQLFFRLGLDDASRRQVFHTSERFAEVATVFKDAGRSMPESPNMEKLYVNNVTRWLDLQNNGPEDRVRRSKLLLQAIRSSPCAR